MEKRLISEEDYKLSKLTVEMTELFLDDETRERSPELYLEAEFMNKFAKLKIKYYEKIKPFYDKEKEQKENEF